MREIRYGLRALRNNPGLTIAAILVLAAGIGANTAVFSAVYAVLLKPLPYTDPARLVVALHDGRAPVSPADYLDYKSQATVFTDMAAAQGWSGLIQTGEKSEVVRGLQITPNMISLLGVTPLLGRPPADRELLLSHRLWQERFAADPNIVNRTLIVNGKVFTVSGVMPPEFRFAPFWITEAEMWTALDLTPRLNDRAGRSLRVFARLRPGVSLTQAQAQMTGIAGRLAAAYPRTNTNLGIGVVSLPEKAAGSMRPALLLLFGTAGFVLLIACADIGNLLLARAVSRRREIATRIALGASRFQLARQLAMESLLLSSMGGVLGILFALTLLQLLAATVPPAALPRQTEIALNIPVLLFAIAASLATGLFAALIPALQSTRTDVNESLKEGGRGSSPGRSSRRTQNFFIAAQVSLALMLLICAGLLAKSLHNLNSINPGFDAHNLLTFDVATPTPQPEVFARIVSQLQATPGVESVSTINHLPVGGDVWTLSYQIPGRPAPLPGHEFGAVYRVVRPDYFRTMHIAILRGRDLNAHDRDVVIVNNTLARKQWPGENPLGRQLVFEGRPLEVIGVTADVVQGDWSGVIDDEIYLPVLQRPTAMGMNSQTFVVRTKTASFNLHGKAAFSHVFPMERVIADRLWQSRIAAWLLSVFAGLALALSAAGIYGVIAYSVRMRRLEIGIRMALGANVSGILALITRETAIPVAAGIGIGLTGALAATRVITALLYHVPPTDPVTFVLVLATLLLSGAAATAIPVWRATRGPIRTS